MEEGEPGLHFRPGGRKPLLPKCVAGTMAPTRARASCRHSVCAVTSVAGGLRGEGGGRHREVDPGDLPFSVKLLLVGSED